jgi:hypothetical protein
VGKHVSQTDDLAGIRDLISKGRVLSAQTSQRLSNDLQLSLDDKLQGAITAKILEGLAPTKGLNLFDGAQNVLI